MFHQAVASGPRTGRRIIETPTADRGVGRYLLVIFAACNLSGGSPVESNAECRLAPAICVMRLSEWLGRPGLRERVHASRPRADYIQESRAESIFVPRAPIISSARAIGVLACAEPEYPAVGGTACRRIVAIALSNAGWSAPNST